jgi:hypothetical protein
MKYAVCVKHFYAHNLPANPVAVYSCGNVGSRATVRRLWAFAGLGPEKTPFFDNGTAQVGMAWPRPAAN